MRADLCAVRHSLTNVVNFLQSLGICVSRSTRWISAQDWLDWVEGQLSPRRITRSHCERLIASSKPGISWCSHQTRSTPRSFITFTCL